MGKYTVLDDPLLDQTVETHLQRIVAAITSCMNPDAVILRGSFGRGEGSVMTGEGHPRFLSDYEIDVATLSPAYRSLFADLSRRLTDESGVDTGVRWVRPDFLSTLRAGPVPIGPAPITIELYESRYGSRILCGRDIIGTGPTILPEQIELFEGVLLVLNRMAESLGYMRRAAEPETGSLVAYYWITKTILACADALLLLWGQYHFSYAERGRRFEASAESRLGFMRDQSAAFSALVIRAIEFKLRPGPNPYPGTVNETWRQVVSVCEAVLLHLAEQVLGFSFTCYTEFPEQFLHSMAHWTRSLPRWHYAMWKLRDAYRYLRARELPRKLAQSVCASHVVYAVVPLIFVGWACAEEDLPALLWEARRRLSAVCQLDVPLPDPNCEWDALRRQLLWAWRNFCY